MRRLGNRVIVSALALALGTLVVPYASQCSLVCDLLAPTTCCPKGHESPTSDHEQLRSPPASCCVGNARIDVAYGATFVSQASVDLAPQLWMQSEPSSPPHGSAFLPASTLGARGPPHLVHTRSIVLIL